MKGLIKACRRTGISVFPWVSDFYSDLDQFDDQRPHSLEEYEKRFGNGYCANLPQRYWISNGGRALETFGRYAPKQSAEQIMATNPRGCREPGEVNHFHIDLYGNYVPGLCAGLSIKREDLGTPLIQKEYPIISRLYAKGIGEFVKHAVEKYGFKASEKGYACKCDLCYAVRRFLVAEKEYNSKELQPTQHYLI